MTVFAGRYFAPLSEFEFQMAVLRSDVQGIERLAVAKDSLAGDTIILGWGIPLRLCLTTAKAID